MPPIVVICELKFGAIKVDDTADNEVGDTADHTTLLSGGSKAVFIVGNVTDETAFN